jgi:hypothetical protein
MPGGILRRSLMAGLCAVLAAPVLAQQRPPRTLPQREPVESPEGIVLRLLTSYRDGRPIVPEAMPLVPRLQDALRRTDLGIDPIAEPDRPVTRIVVDIPEATGGKRASVAGRFSHGTDERLIMFDFDVTTGDWLITDIRPRSGPSLRQLLRISR